LAGQGIFGRMAKVRDPASVSFKIEVQRGPPIWKWELYVESDEIPVAAGTTVGTKADLDAAVLRAQMHVLENWEEPRG
jgi:hypothetical protein